MSALKDAALAHLETLGGESAESFGQTHVTLPAASIRDAVSYLRKSGFEQLSDIFGIDYQGDPEHHGARFHVVYNLYAISEGERLMLRVGVSDGESVPSVAPQWKAAEFMEREVYDMYGIEFDGHPDLRKLITPEDLDGFPLRKDFSIGESPTLFGDGRFLDPATFRAGMLGQDQGRTGWVGGARKGVTSEQTETTSAHTGEQGSGGDA